MTQLTDGQLKARGLRSPAEQSRDFGEVIHDVTFKCDKCQEVSSVKTADGGHLCIDHALARAE